MASDIHFKDTRTNRLDKFRKEVETDAHLIPLEELYDRLLTNSENGLPSTEAKQILLRNGPNALTPPKKSPEYIKFLKTLVHGFSILLWIGAALSIIAFIIEYNRVVNPGYDNLFLGLILIAVVLITGIFAYYQENKSSKVK